MNEQRTASSSAPPGGRLEALDWLRLIAALAVVAYHWLYFGVLTDYIAVEDELSPSGRIARYGMLGVELFFLISGYVILNSARHRDARGFVVARVVRLYPAFWVAMSITAAAIVLWGRAAHLSMSWHTYLWNLTMIPRSFGASPVDGVYWTLGIELRFYLLIGLLLLLGLQRVLPQVIAGWAGLMLALTLLLPGLSKQIYLGDFYLLFAAGALLAETHRRAAAGERRPWWLNAGLAAAIIGSVIASWRRALTRAVPGEGDGIPWDPWVYAALVVLAIALIAALGIPRIARARLPGSRAAGGLTYPLYLLHANLGYIVFSHLATPQTLWWVQLITLTAIMLGAWTLHRVVEVRGKRFWTRAFDATLGRLVGALQSLVRRVLPAAR